MNDNLTHIDETGRARMVDVSKKDDTLRIAIAKGDVVMKAKTLEAIQQGLIKKGDVLSVAQIAGIMAAKRAYELIPMCHPIAINQVEVDLTINSNLPGIHITSVVKTIGKTGAEMEALTAVSIAALTVYDMAKALEKTMHIQNIRLISKTGGKSGVVINE
jgi:cyclic pyranopterin phosphate synthase